MAADWQWEESLDALAAAPAQHRLVFENSHIRVLDTRIAPGERNVGAGPLHIISTEVKSPESIA